MSYYDIDAILTEAEKVPCNFNLELPDLGYLDNDNSHPLKSGTPITLPLWLAELLALANSASPSNPDPTPFLTLSLPTSLSNAVLSALKADPRAVPLRDQSQNFYGLGMRMLDLFEEREICAALRRTFVSRAGEIALHGRKAGGDGKGVGSTGDEFLRGLDELERRLFREAHEGSKGCREWMEGVKK